MIEKPNFSLKGNFTGNQTKYITLKYFDENEAIINDTCNIANNHFAFSGNIKEPTLAFLKANTASNLAEDPNSINIFLEPGNMKVEIVENNFKSLKLIGSKTQSQYNSLNRIELPVREKGAPLDSQADKLADSIRMFLRRHDTISAEKIVDKRSEIIIIGMKPYKDEINRIERRFIKDNPKSFLGPYLLNQQLIIFKWDKDSVRFCYDNLTRDVQSSYWGKETRKRLDGILPVGSVFPNLQGINNNDKNITIGSLLKNHDYTLIIFWASWCIPCRQLNPAYASIYKEYHDKGLKIIAITLEDDRKRWLEAIQKDNTFNWTRIFLNNAIGVTYNIYGLSSIPAEILLKRNTVIAKYAGADNQNSGIEDLKSKLKDIFSMKGQ